MASEIKFESISLDISLVGDIEMTKINNTYRNKNKTTDVLSFPLLEGEGGEFSHGHLGDLVISVPTAFQQAKLYGVSRKEEITRLLIHGILHLLGYDHEKVSKNKAQQMRRKEKMILDAIS